jgi:hypothetical protein
MGEFALTIRHWHDVDLQPELLTRFGVVDDLFTHRMEGEQGGADSIQDIPLSVLPLKEARTPAQYFLPGVTRAADKGIIHIQDTWSGFVDGLCLRDQNDVV